MSLELRIADTAIKRLLGLHAMGLPDRHTGLCLEPCSAIHTFWLSAEIDVVFLDGNLVPARVVSRLAPGRIAFCPGARCVVELAAGYCEEYPDFAQRIRSALTRGSGCQRRPRKNIATNR